MENNDETTNSRIATGPKRAQIMKWPRNNTAARGYKKVATTAAARSGGGIQMVSQRRRPSKMVHDKILFKTRIHPSAVVNRDFNQKNEDGSDDTTDSEDIPHLIFGTGG